MGVGQDTERRPQIGQARLDLRVNAGVVDDTLDVVRKGEKEQFIDAAE